MADNFTDDVQAIGPDILIGHITMLLRLTVDNAPEDFHTYASNEIPRSQYVAIHAILCMMLAGWHVSNSIEFCTGCAQIISM